MFLKLFDIVPGFVWALMLAGALVMAGVAKMGHNSEIARHADTKVEYHTYQLNAEKRENVRAQFALAEGEKQRELERNRSKAAQETQNALLAETSRTAAARAVAVERGRVRGDDIARFATGSAVGGQSGGNPAADPGATERALTLGRLLATCRTEGDGDAGELEDLASQVRGLKARYLSLSPLSSPAAPPPTGARPEG